MFANGCGVPQVEEDLGGMIHLNKRKEGLSVWFGNLSPVLVDERIEKLASIGTPTRES